MQLKQLCDFCDDFLSAQEFEDYCPNGLQVEASDEVNHIVSGVTASLDLIEAAIAVKADTLLVHHGYFWKGEAQVITGFKGRRIRALIENNINLIAFHLPLDVHAEVGNNVQLGKKMGWDIQDSFASIGTQDIVLQGMLPSVMTLEQLSESIESRLNTRVLSISASEKPVRTIAWCTGAAQNYIEQAAAHGVDVFVSGEVSEHTFHFAREAGIHYIAAGHHATERFGVQALAAVIGEKFGVRQQFIDIPNPV
jgi:dinuclear metal center YbgI/SA1388 family protein